MSEAMDQAWPIRLFNKSVLKQNKFKEIVNLLGSTDRLNCLDIGSDNGVVSFLLRKRGGDWKSADLDAKAVQSIRDLVGENVFQIDGGRTLFRDNEFDRIVIIDFLEHIPDDQAFIIELFRITRPGGELIINVPHVKNSLLRKFRLALGQTDEKHGHVRPGYTLETLNGLLGRTYTIFFHKTYSKFFSEFIDTLMIGILSFLKRGESNSQKGILMLEQDLQKYRKMFKIYSLIYPLLWFFGKLDQLLSWRSGYMLIVKAKVNK
jgi:SAM-dependent methyltransferase